MTTYDFVHMTFLAVGGKIQGKTRLQKTVYFLGLFTKKEEELGYRPHFYGPYSDEVATAVGRLKALGFLDQTIAGVGTVDNRGFEVARHDYVLNDAGKMIGELKRRQHPELWHKMQGASKAMQGLLNKDYMTLSIAAKTYFLLGERTASMKELANLAPKFGWSVTPQQVQEAAHLLEGAGLVKISDN